MRAGPERQTDRFVRLREIDHGDLVTRRHHRADGQIAQPHHARDHLLFAGLQHAGILGLDHERVDFLLAHLLLSLAALAEHPQQRLAGAIEDPDQRQRYFREHHHRGRDLYRHSLGIAQSDLLRHQFADNQRGIGNERHHRADAERIGGALRQPHTHKPYRQPRAERRARERAGQHADQRDADLHGGEKFSGVRRQREGAARATHALFNKSGQPRGTGRDNGEF